MSESGKSPWPKRKSKIPGRDITIREEEFAHRFVETGGNATEACRLMGSSSARQLSGYYMKRPNVRARIQELVAELVGTEEIVRLHEILRGQLWSENVRERDKGVSNYFKLLSLGHRLPEPEKPEEPAWRQDVSDAEAEWLRKQSVRVLEYVVRNKTGVLPAELCERIEAGEDPPLPDSLMGDH